MTSAVGFIVPVGPMPKPVDSLLHPEQNGWHSSASLH